MCSEGPEGGGDGSVPIIRVCTICILTRLTVEICIVADPRTKTWECRPHPSAAPAPCEICCARGDPQCAVRSLELAGGPARHLHDSPAAGSPRWNREVWSLHPGIVYLGIEGSPSLTCMERESIASRCDALRGEAHRPWLEGLWSQVDGCFQV